MLKLEGKKIYLACGSTDMRKSINSLSVTVASDFGLDVFASSLFVFCNKGRDILKILEWDGDGFWLHLKRLEQGRFKWPKSAEEDRTMNLSEDELRLLLGCPGLEQKFKRKQLFAHSKVV